jgi:hypothetical protein
VNWDEGNSYASASSLALSARDPGSRPGSAAGAPPGVSRLGPGAGLGSGSADLSDLDANPFAAGATGAASAAGNGAGGAGLGAGPHARYDEDGILLDDADASSRRTSRGGGGGRPGAEAAPARRSLDGGGAGAGGARAGAPAGPRAAAAAPARRDSSDGDSEEDFLAQARPAPLSRVRAQPLPACLCAEQAWGTPWWPAAQQRSSDCQRTPCCCRRYPRQRARRTLVC